MSNNKSAPITAEMIKKHFGPDAAIERRLGGVFRVNTPRGGEIEIDQTRFRVHTGGEQIYAAMTLLGAEAWGGLTVSGPREHILAFLAHGDALGVNVTIRQERSGSGCLRICAALIGAVVAIPAYLLASVFGAENAGQVAIGAAVVATILMLGIISREQKENERRRIQELYFLYPRQHGLPRDASHDDAQRGGWL